MQRTTGAVAAAVISAGSWLITHTVYGVLRIMYRRDLRVVALFAAIIAAFVLMIRWII